VVQDKPGILRFLQAIQPYCIVKAAQVALGIEFLDTFAGGGTFRDSLGRIRGKMLTADEVERRERLRLAMRDLNAMGPPKTPPSQLPPLDVQHRRRAEAEYVGNPATIKRGETRWNARLTEETVRAIRAEYAAGTAFQQELADRYNVSLMAINKVLTGKTWKHVT
jgi:hypothetical protein